MNQSPRANVNAIIEKFVDELCHEFQPKSTLEYHALRSIAANTILADQLRQKFAATDPFDGPNAKNFQRIVRAIGQFERSATKARRELQELQTQRMLRQQNPEIAKEIPPTVDIRPMLAAHPKQASYGPRRENVPAHMVPQPKPQNTPNPVPVKEKAKTMAA